MDNLLERYQQQGYRVILQLRLDNMRPFLQENLRKKNVYTLFYLICVVTGGVMLCGGLLLLWMNAGSVIGFIRDVLSTFLAGILLLLLLIPVHELLHGLAFKLCGVSKVRFGVQWRQFLFYAAADGEAITLKQFRIVALTPLLVISTILLVVVLLSHHWLVVSSACLALVLHLTCCGGDMALLGYFNRFKGQDVISVDDVDGQVSYFLKR